jgi:hypothetical protein
VEGPHMLCVKGLALKVLHHVTPLPAFLCSHGVACNVQEEYVPKSELNPLSVNCTI